MCSWKINFNLSKVGISYQVCIHHAGSSAILTGLRKSSPDDLDKPSLKYGSVCDVQPNLCQGPQVDHRNLEAERDPFCNDMTEALEREADVIRVKTYPDRSQDSSQISGPDRRSKSTPLSQTGFQDPASVGIGQQLMLLSIEVYSIIFPPSFSTEFIKPKQHFFQKVICLITWFKYLHIYMVQFESGHIG